MGTITVTSAILIITAWMALIEFDHLSEEERGEVIQNIKTNPFYFITVALMPVGIIINVLGTVIGSPSMVLAGATMIFIQGLIVSFIFWKRTRWKGVFLFIVVLGLGVFIYLAPVHYLFQ